MAKNSRPAGHDGEPPETIAPPAPLAPGTITVLGRRWSPQSQFKFMIGVLVLMNALLFLKFGLSEKKIEAKPQPLAATNGTASAGTQPGK